VRDLQSKALDLDISDLSRCHKLLGIEFGIKNSVVSEPDERMTN